METHVMKDKAISGNTERKGNEYLSKNMLLSRINSFGHCKDISLLHKNYPAEVLTQGWT